MQSFTENPCQISLPEGLQELMSDITREVLRAQPRNVYSFIANYLGALLEVRDTVSIAADVCNSIQDVSYHTELLEELKNIGLADEDVGKAADVIRAFLESDQVEETKLFLQILRKTSIEEDQLEAFQSAVQRAFRKHRLSRSKIHCSRTKTTWGKRAGCSLILSDTAAHGHSRCQGARKCVAGLSDAANASSTSLAGSFVTLPRSRPYSAHDNLSIVSEGTSAKSDSKCMSDAINDGNDTISLKSINFALYS